MIKRFLLLMLCFLTIIAIGCTIDDAIKIVTDNITEEPEEPVIEEPAPVVDENKPEDFIMELKPIKQFSNYVASPAEQFCMVVYGIDQGILEKVILEDTEDNLYPFDSFFMYEGKIYFTVKDFINDDPAVEAVEETHYFEQTGNDIVKILKSEFPMPRASEHIEFEGNDFKIKTTPYDIDGVPIPTSRVYKGLLVIGYLKIDGCVLVENGLWFSVAETIKTRYEGVYLWTIGGSAPNRILESGRIY